MTAFPAGKILKQVQDDSYCWFWGRFLFFSLSLGEGRGEGLPFGYFLAIFGLHTGILLFLSGFRFNDRFFSR